MHGRPTIDLVFALLSQRLVHFAAFLTCTLVGLLLLQATQSLSAKAETFRLVTGNDFAPYADIQLPNGGLITELVEAVYCELGLDTEIQFGDWDQGYVDTLSGRFQATFPYQPDQVKTDEFFLSRPLLIVRHSVFVSSRGRNRFWTLNDLDDKKLCLPNTYRSNKNDLTILSSNKSEIRRTSSTAEYFRVLGRDEVGFIPTYDLHGIFSAHEAFGSMDRFTVLRDSLGASSFHLLIPKSQPNAVAHQQNFDLALREIASRGDIERMIRRHMSSFQTGTENR